MPSSTGKLSPFLSLAVLDSRAVSAVHATFPVQPHGAAVLFITSATTTPADLIAAAATRRAAESDTAVCKSRGRASMGWRMGTRCHASTLHTVASTYPSAYIAASCLTRTATGAATAKCQCVQPLPRATTFSSPSAESRHCAVGSTAAAATGRSHYFRRIHQQDGFSRRVHRRQAVLSQSQPARR